MLASSAGPTRHRARDDRASPLPMTTIARHSGNASLAAKSLGLVALAALAISASGCDSSSSPSRPSDSGAAGPSGDAAPAPRHCSGKSGSVGESTISVSEPGAPDGGLRSAIVHVPASYDVATPTMLVLNFHG